MKSQLSLQSSIASNQFERHPRAMTRICANCLRMERILGQTMWADYYNLYFSLLQKLHRACWQTILLQPLTWNRCPYCAYTKTVKKCYARVHTNRKDVHIQVGNFTARCGFVASNIKNTSGVKMSTRVGGGCVSVPVRTAR